MYQPLSQPENTNNDTNNANGQIYVKTLTGKNIVLDYDKNMKIVDVKNHVFSQENIPVEQQRLIYQGKQLEDDFTLANYEIIPDSTLHLVLRLR